MDGYLIQQPFADLIASGQKTWDVRIRKISPPRGRFYILATTRPHPIAAGYPQDRLGISVAIATRAESIGPMGIEEMMDHFEEHKINEDVLREYARSRPLYAMALTAEPCEPRRYVKKQGTVHLIVNVEFE
jgi:hypothetical protein